MRLNIEHEMSDLLDMLLELQKLCLPQALEKIIDHISFSKKLEIKYIFSSVHELIIAFWLRHANKLFLLTLVNRNQEEEK